MKRTTLLALIISIMATFGLLMCTVHAADDYVSCEIKEGKCTLVDNASTNPQASGYPICFAPAYGIGRATNGDTVVFKNVTLTKPVTSLALKCGYNLGGDKVGTGTEFRVYLNSVLYNTPVAKFAVNDSETASAQIKDQVYKYANVYIAPGTYDVYIVASSNYSGSCSELRFFYHNSAASISPSTSPSNTQSDYVSCEIKEGKCTLVDNSSTNHQASGYPICFASAYGIGRTTNGDAVIFKNVTLTKPVTSLALKCGYNLGGDKVGTGTEFRVYLNSVLYNTPVAKFAVNDSETASAQIKDQVYKYANVYIAPGTYDVYIVASSNYSGSCSELRFIYDVNSSPSPSAFDSRAVTISIPTFRININGTTINNSYLQYPYIVYNDITYFPMTYHGARFLGLESNWSASEGLNVRKLSVGSLGDNDNTQRSKINTGSYSAVTTPGTIVVNGKPINNTTETYPLINFRDVTYFPLTWRFAVDEFGWEYSYSNSAGLVINSK